MILILLFQYMILVWIIYIYYFTLSPQLHNSVTASVVMIMVVQIHSGHGIVVGGGVVLLVLLLLL